MQVDGRRLRVTNLDKVVYPETGTTKGEVIAYYTTIARSSSRSSTAARSPASAGSRGRHRRRSRGLLLHEAARARRPGLDPATGHPALRRPQGVPAGGGRAHARLARAGRGDRVARAAVAVHPGGASRPSRPSRARSRPRTRRRPRAVRRGRPDRSDAPHRDGARPSARDQRQQGHPPLRGPARRADQRRGLRRGQRAGAHHRERAPGPRHERHVQGRARGKVFLDWSQNNGKKTTISPYSLRGRAAPASRRRAPGRSSTTRTSLTSSWTRCSRAQAPDSIRSPPSAPTLLHCRRTRTPRHRLELPRSGRRRPPRPSRSATLRADDVPTGTTLPSLAPMLAENGTPRSPEASARRHGWR